MLRLNLDKKYWKEKYSKQTGNWDIGYVSPPLEEYFTTLNNFNLKILIPGCGNAYEVEYLYSKGFKKVIALDWADNIIDEFKKRAPNFPEKNIVSEDFFLHIGKYDLIIEQTFFCSLPVNQRNSYAKKMYELLNPGGHLVGLLFNREFDFDEPPYGGTEEEYINIFKPYFYFKHFSTAYNSIKPRAGKEIFLNLIKL